jgi:hypothetical protein
MQIHSIPKPPKQKVHDMGLSDLHEEEFKLFAVEYNAVDDEPDNDRDHYVTTLWWPWCGGYSIFYLAVSNDDPNRDTMQ